MALANATKDIPSTGLEVWYKLEGRSQRSTIQGRIRLKLFLSTREDLGTSEEDNWTEIKQQEKLHGIFIDYELSVFKVRRGIHCFQICKTTLSALESQYGKHGHAFLSLIRLVRGRFPPLLKSFVTLRKVLQEFSTGSWGKHTSKL